MMDTSKQYIEMCEQALPDIGCHSWSDGDFAYRNGKVEVFHQKAADNMGWQTGDQCIPIYRQDQLQEMVKDIFPLNNDGKYYWHKLFITFLTELNIYDWSWSPEQLWLVFVLKKKFNKIWNGENWIEESISQTYHK
jgi:hypothetical protein